MVTDAHLLSFYFVWEEPAVQNKKHRDKNKAGKYLVNGLDNSCKVTHMSFLRFFISLYVGTGKVQPEIKNIFNRTDVNNLPVIAVFILDIQQCPAGTVGR
jgi:hypothetical protein